MNPPPSGADDDDENELDRSLERALQRPALSDEALERVRANVYAEFRQTAGAARRRRTRWIGAVAAALGTVVVGAFLISSYWMPEIVVAQLVSASGGDVLTAEGPARTRVEAGGVLHPLGAWTTRGLALAKLPSGGTVRMAEGTVVQGVDSHTLALTSGKAYFDFPPASEPFVLRTTIGTIEHVGTQFEAAAGGSETRIRVREGSVRMNTARDAQFVNAGTEVVISNAGAVTRRALPTYGPDWEWVESIAPEFEIENRQLGDFLSWVARETGRRVEFVDDRARDVAGQTLLHGSVHGLAPLAALEQVLSTTSLRYEIHDDAIRVSSHR